MAPLFRAGVNSGYQVRVRERFWGLPSPGGWCGPISHSSGILLEKKRMEVGWFRQSKQSQAGEYRSRVFSRFPPLQTALSGIRATGPAAQRRAHAHSAAPRPLLKIPFHVLLVVGATGSPPAFGRSAPWRSQPDRRVGGPWGWPD